MSTLEADLSNIDIGRVREHHEGIIAADLAQLREEVDKKEACDGNNCYVIAKRIADQIVRYADVLDRNWPAQSTVADIPAVSALNPNTTHYLDVPDQIGRNGNWADWSGIDESLEHVLAAVQSRSIEIERQISEELGEQLSNIGESLMGGSTAAILAAEKLTQK